MVSTTDARGVLHAVAGSLDRTGKPHRAAVYCQVSSAEQAQAGTIENQAKRALFTGPVDARTVAEDGALDITACFADSSGHALPCGQRV